MSESGPTEARLQGHLQIGLRDGIKSGDVKSETRPRLMSRDLSFKLDGVELGGRLKYLKFEVAGLSVVEAELTIYVTDVEIDLPAAELLLQLQRRQDGEPDAHSLVVGESEEEDPALRLK